MKTRPDSLIQLKSGRDSHWCFRIWQLFCHTSGFQHRHLKPNCALQNDSFGTSATHLLLPQSFFISLFSYFHALLQFIRAVHSLLLAKQGSVKRVTLVYLFHAGALTTNCRLQSWTLYKSSDCRWISITILCVRFTTSAIVGRLEQA